MDENYGSYSCTKRCTYAVHTNCATLLDVWAGEELEDRPETEYDNLEPFQEIDDGIIRHFSHAHHYMRLNEDIERAFDAKQQYCQACILALYDGNVYSCMECDFVLHETCANLPRIKRIGVHGHPLVLKLIPAERFFCCYLCDCYSCGFVYMCIWEGCPSKFCVDVRCASLSELVDHPSHPHPLFLFYDRGIYQKCSTCETLSYRSLNCVECDFVLCIRCANLPYKVKYEQDEHMLSLSYEKNATNPYWCQVCEETADPKKGYYRCNECGVTFHIECILGNDFYMKTGEFLTSYEKVEIILNDRLSRPICKTCKRRCRYNIVFKTSRGHIFCSIEDLKASQLLSLLPI